MFKTRFISMLVLLMTAVTGAWADTTVTWEGTKLQSIAVCKGYNTNVTTESMTVDGITITANDGYLLNGPEGVVLYSGAANGVVFSAENNIKSITITSTGFSQFTPDGDFQDDGGSHTYEVSPAATSYGFENDVEIEGITKIEITLEGAPTVAGYTVSMKEGTEDATSWTIAPAEATTTGVAAGTTVTATYSGMKKVKSVKAVKKAAAPAEPTLAQTMTTADMTVKVKYIHSDEENYCQFLSKGDGTYTFQSGDGYVGGDGECAKALVVEGGKLVFKQNTYSDIDYDWNFSGFSVTFDTINNTYSEWRGLYAANEETPPSFISVEVNGTTIAVTAAQ